jgi:succinoglycan biosynthesis transport protein ExoP
MLQFDKATKLSSAENGGSSLEGLTFAIKIIKQQFPVILLVVACVVALSMIYLFSAQPRFTATAALVIDTRKGGLFQQQSLLGDMAIDPTLVDTQVEILQSENVSLAVIKDMHLTEDQEFVGPGGGLLSAVTGALFGLFETSEPASEFVLTRTAVARLVRQRTIKRLGVSYAIEIGFTSIDADKAARIANALADAYIVDQLEAKYQATRRASVWLQDRIKELRTQATAAERAVVEFKQRNGIVDTGGRLMNEQQLAELSSQLMLIRASTAEAKARYDRIQEIMSQEVPTESVTDALRNDVIVRLRQQYLDLSAREANWSQRYGHGHLAAVNLRNQMEEIRRSINNELRRISEAYKSDLDIAKAREESIKNSLAEVVSETQSTNQAQIQLRELESNSQTYRALYDNFLQRYMEAVQQQSFPITEARVISPASQPLSKSSPKTLLVLAVGLLGSLMLGFGVAVIRELFLNVFHTGRNIEDLLQVNCLAVVPLWKEAAAVKSIGDGTIDAGPRGSSAMSVGLSGLRNFHGLIGKYLQGSLRSEAYGANSLDGKRSRSTVTGAASGKRENQLLRAVVISPLSRFAEAIRSLKVAIDLNKTLKANKVIGVTSTLPGEGKSTLAANLAQIIAHSGGNVILVDCDLRNPSLSRSLMRDPEHESGLIDVISGKSSLQDVLKRDPATNLIFLPAGLKVQLPHPNEVLGSNAVGKLFEQLRSSYDYVVVDLPPLAPVVDVRTTTNFIDGYIYTIEWGQTKTDVVEHCLSGAQEIYDRLLGAVLNKADVNALGRYDGYYKKYYHRYGYVE